MRTFFFLLCVSVSACGGEVVHDLGSSNPPATSNPPGSSTPPASSTAGANGTSACGPVVAPTAEPKTLDRHFWGYHGVASDGVDVYYTGKVDGQVLRVRGSGGKPEQVSSLDYMRNVKGHGGRVCWMSESVIECVDAGGKPWRVHSSGGRGDSWATFRDFDFDGAHVYWLNQHSVWRAPIDGNGPATLVIDGEDDTRTIAVTGDRVVWTTETFATVRSCEKAACASPIDLVSFGRPAAAIFGGLAADAQHVYVPVHIPGKDGRRGGQLLRIPAAGGAAQTLTSCLDESPVNVAVDATTAVLVTHGNLEGTTQFGSPRQGGSVIAIPLDGTTPRLLAERQSYPAHVAITPTAIFWMNELDRQGELQTLAR